VLDSLSTFLNDRRDAMAADLARLIQVPSIRGSDRDGPVAGIGQALGVARELSERAGFRYQQIEDWVGFADMGDGAETVGVLLHLDVVPAGEGWTHPPFSGALVDGEVWGRGAQDDKGPAISVLYAAEAVLQAGLPFRRHLRLIFGTDEESGIWTDMAKYLEHEPAPALGFVPDGCFPITSGEKGVLNVDLAARPLPGAPAREVTVTSLWAGERANIVPGSARAVLEPAGSLGALAQALAERAEAYNSTHAGAAIGAVVAAEGVIVTAGGQIAHGSDPAAGHSALLDLVDFLDAEDLTENGPGQMIRFLSSRVGFDLCGERLGLFARHSFVGCTTVNIGVVATGLDGVCRAEANIRIPVGKTIADMVSGLEHATAAHNRVTGHGLRVDHVGAGHEPLFVEPESELVRALSRAYETSTGQPADLKSIGGTTFAKAMPNLVAFGPGMEGDPGHAHQVDERTSVDVLVRNALIYAAAIRELCCRQ